MASVFTYNLAYENAGKPGPRRRPQGEKYVVDMSQSNLRIALPKYRNACRSPSIQMHVIGPFDDHSSDNSDEKSLNQQHQRSLQHTTTAIAGFDQYQQRQNSKSNHTIEILNNKQTTTKLLMSGNGNVSDADATTSTHGVPFLRSFFGADSKLENYEEVDVISARTRNQNLAISDAIRNDIAPPPGAPKLENSARLRRYRHNLD